MVKKPILTDDDFGDPPDHASPLPPARPVATGGATRQVDGPQETPRTTEAASGGRDASGHARPKTRILGISAARDDASQAQDNAGEHPPVGWLVVVSGPGKGAACALTMGMNAIGRGDNTHVQLDYGDNSISREAHAYVTYDDEARRFFVTHAGKTNLVRLNDTPVLATHDLTHGDTIRIGATTLRFVALCGADFDWTDT
ncbi:FHA domain-containing protein [Gymnodinialimonas sp. 57CJ19]|uniref:FHA domain-containing protein n=1 Tax=Gymnodinialimonas sp. 57CJ19 TaxID=3138498 RepID=UPI0031344FEF